MKNDKNNWRAGTTLSCDCGTFWHYGVADGAGGVIHNSKKCSKVVRENEQEFSDGKKVEKSETIVSKDLAAAYNRALKNVGKPYHLFSDNCEHFVRMAHGLPIKSRQVSRHIFSVAAIVIAFVKGAHPALRIGAAVFGVVGLFNKNKDK